MFDNIHGNELNKEILKNMINERKYGHAYLFSGPKGTQKRKIAIEFIKGIFCLSEGERPCHVCSQCHKIESGNHPDFHEIRPEDENIKIQQIRDMQKSMMIKPYEGDKKVYLVNSCESMGVPAQNSLLKILEEPSGSTMVILVANSKKSILPTILSRCQILNFNPLAKASFVTIMTDEYGTDADEADLLFQLTQGRIDEAGKMIRYPEKKNEYRIIEEHLDLLRKGNVEKIFDITKMAKEKGIDDIKLTDYLLIYFRNILINKALKVENYDEDCLTIPEINDIIERIIDIQSNTKINVNMQLQVESLLLKIQEE
ncbi:MAG: DNA polymerase III subunit delta' [Eubacteriaceae bacterium]|nr:DNA polymerase III subunit delta' [Eubacteriaceae bacterium]